jgi:hypothetical protein
MAWIILLDSCYVSGQPYEAGPHPLQVSGPDARLLISQRMAVACSAPDAVTPATVCKTRTTKPPTQK